MVTVLYCLLGVIYHMFCSANCPPDSEVVTALPQVFFSTLGCDVNLAMEELAFISGRELVQNTSYLWQLFIGLFNNTASVCVIGNCFVQLEYTEL